MLIYANWRENGAADMIFFHQKMHNWYLGNYKKKKKKRARIIFTRLNRRRKKKKKKKKKPNAGSKWNPPRLHLSVNAATEL